MLLRRYRSIQDNDRPPFENSFEIYSEHVESAIKVFFEPSAVEITGKKPTINEIGCNANTQFIHGMLMNTIDPSRIKTSSIESKQFLVNF